MGSGYEKKNEQIKRWIRLGYNRREIDLYIERR